VIGAAAELQNVGLSDAHVFQQFPGRMRRARRPFPAKTGRETFNGRVESKVRAATAQ
jgi:hypothetical protein